MGVYIVVDIKIHCGAGSRIASAVLRIGKRKRIPSLPRTKFLFGIAEPVRAHYLGTCLQVRMGHRLKRPVSWCIP